MIRHSLKQKINFIRLESRKTELILGKTCKAYKSLLNSKFKIFDKKRREKIRENKVKNPKIYWDLIQGDSKGSISGDISVEEFGTFFKNLNVQENSDTTQISFKNKDKDPYEELNAPFSENELKTALKSLKNNKSTGEDSILNEQIKLSYPKMSAIYLKLLNIILDTGCFPESWPHGRKFKFLCNRKGGFSKFLCFTVKNCS